MNLYTKGVEEKSVQPVRKDKMRQKNRYSEMMEYKKMKNDTKV